jgi:hypothetical protein
MALVIEAPNEIYSLKNHKNLKMFLAGGISKCPDWQSYVIGELKNVDNLTIYNPRRKKFPIDNPAEAEQQITWEFNHLRDATVLFFWFSRGSLNPIALYELGMWCNSDDKIAIIGVDPEYERKSDVIMQTNLARPNIEIFDSIDKMTEEVRYIVNMIMSNIEED